MLRGRVIDHADSLELTNCTFKVRTSGREKVVREKRKNVHAFVVGHYFPMSKNKVLKPHGWDSISYDPYRGPTFFDTKRYRSPEYAASVVFCDDGSVWGSNVVYFPLYKGRTDHDSGHHDDYYAYSKRNY